MSRNSAYTDKSYKSNEKNINVIDKDINNDIELPLNTNLDNSISEKSESISNNALDIEDLASDIASNVDYYQNNPKVKYSKIILKLKQKIIDLKQQNDVLNEELNRLQFKDINILEKNVRSSKIEIESLEQRSLEYRERIQELEEQLFITSKNTLLSTITADIPVKSNKKLINYNDKIRQLELKNNHLVKLNNSYQQSIKELELELINFKNSNSTSSSSQSINHVRYAPIEYSDSLTLISEETEKNSLTNSNDNIHDSNQNIKNPISLLPKSQRALINRYIQQELKKLTTSHLTTIRELSNELNKFANADFQNETRPILELNNEIINNNNDDINNILESLTTNNSGDISQFNLDDDKNSNLIRNRVIIQIFMKLYYIILIVVAITISLFVSYKYISHQLLLYGIIK